MLKLICYLALSVQARIIHEYPEDCVAVYGGKKNDNRCDCSDPACDTSVCESKFQKVTNYSEWKNAVNPDKLYC